MPKEASREPAHTLQPGRRCQQVSAVTLSNRAPRQHLPSWQWTWARVGGGAEVGAGGGFVRVPRGSAGLQLTLRGGPGTQAAVCAWLCLGPAGCHPLPEAGSGQALPPLDSEVLSTPRFILPTSSLCVEEGNSSHFAERTRNVNSFLVFLRYQCYYEYPLLTYLEYPILIAQDVLLLLCAFHFNGNVKGAAPYMAVFVASWFVLPLQKWIIDLAMNLSTFISVASKFAQLQYLWKTRDSGTVSALTWSLAAYTCATRIITTIMTTGDLTILTRFVIMLALNVWVTTTVLRYRKTAVKAE
ncbi:solute carrier family 66 member 3 isoform X1 [Panthera tigris]|uniref:solute carrier family 66 member 3 isoform X1 n=1 Tax=Panthera tigris TaxID=9694 RepID=UPI001C6FC50A|nr:solute carrier family 66 member 3 isoform X1 [Panthera tigris]